MAVSWVRIFIACIYWYIVASRSMPIPPTKTSQNFSCFYMGSPCRTAIRRKVRNISWALFTERNRKYLKPGTLQSLFNNKIHEFKDINGCFLTKNLLDVCEIEVSSPTMPCWRVNTRLILTESKKGSIIQQLVDYNIIVRMVGHFKLHSLFQCVVYGRLPICAVVHTCIFL